MQCLTIIHEKLVNCHGPFQALHSQIHMHSEARSRPREPKASRPSSFPGPVPAASDVGKQPVLSCPVGIRHVRISDPRDQILWLSTVYGLASVRTLHVRTLQLLTPVHGGIAYPGSYSCGPTDGLKYFYIISKAFAFTISRLLHFKTNMFYFFSSLEAANGRRTL